jgi:O-antigen ligase
VIALFCARVRISLKFLGLPALLALAWLTDARGPLGAIAIALVVISFVRLRRPASAPLLLLFLVVVALVVAVMLPEQLDRVFEITAKKDYITLNGRTDLWEYAIQLIQARPLHGYGYFASRFVLLDAFFWAGHAHNSFIETTLSTGVVGLCFLLAWTGYLAVQLFKSLSPLLIGVSVYCFIQGMLNPLLFYPGLPMFVLLLCIVNVDARMKSDRQPPVLRGQRIGGVYGGPRRTRIGAPVLDRAQQSSGGPHL